MAGLTNLTHLFATSATDMGLQHLSSLKKLTWLILSYCDTSQPAERSCASASTPQPNDMSHVCSPFRYARIARR